MTKWQPAYEETWMPVCVLIYITLPIFPLTAFVLGMGGFAAGLHPLWFLGFGPWEDGR